MYKLSMPHTRTGASIDMHVRISKLCTVVYFFLWVAAIYLWCPVVSCAVPWMWQYTKKNVRHHGVAGKRG